MMPALSDAKHEKFIQAVFGGLSQRQAYREVYPRSCWWKDATVDVRASQLFNTDKVQIRYAELQEQAKKLAEIEAKGLILSVVDRMVLLSHIARDSESDRIKIRAIDTLNKMDGVYVNKVQLSALDGELSKLSATLRQLDMIDE